MMTTVMCVLVFWVPTELIHSLSWKPRHVQGLKSVSRSIVVPVLLVQVWVAWLARSSWIF